jgi:coenzyme F420-reducing hydrogenase beta subunit
MDNVVWYNGMACTLLFKYDFGYWKIQETTNKYKIELVHYLELEKGLIQFEEE